MKDLWNHRRTTKAPREFLEIIQMKSVTITSIGCFLAISGCSSTPGDDRRIREIESKMEAEDQKVNDTVRIKMDHSGSLLFFRPNDARKDNLTKRFGFFKAGQIMDVIDEGNFNMVLIEDGVVQGIVMDRFVLNESKEVTFNAGQEVEIYLGNHLIMGGTAK